MGCTAQTPATPRCFEEFLWLWAVGAKSCQLQCWRWSHLVGESRSTWTDQNISKHSKQQSPCSNVCNPDANDGCFYRGLLVYFHHGFFGPKFGCCSTSGVEPSTNCRWLPGWNQPLEVLILIQESLKKINVKNPFFPVYAASMRVFFFKSYDMPIPKCDPEVCFPCRQIDWNTSWVFVPFSVVVLLCTRQIVFLPLCAWIHLTRDMDLLLLLTFSMFLTPTTQTTWVLQSFGPLEAQKPGASFKQVGLRVRRLDSNKPELNCYTWLSWWSSKTINSCDMLRSSKSHFQFLQVRLTNKKTNKISTPPAKER